MKNKPLVSIIIPTYNEEKEISNCLRSLTAQSYTPQEIILVDDGSTDKTSEIISSFKFLVSSFKFLHQDHKGPGPARNLGAKEAKGEILVFVDADMTFEKNFIKDLTAPIAKGQTIGTFSKNEMVANSKNSWSVCWNINRNVPPDRMLPKSYPDQAPVFRAILKSEFEKVGGFDATGEYTDDWSLSRKLKVKSKQVKGAVYFHKNPSSLKEVFKQARWIGKSEFISGSLIRKTRSLFFYSIPVSIFIGIYKSILNLTIYFFLFKLIYDFAIWTSVLKSFLGEEKSK